MEDMNKLTEEMIILMSRTDSFCTCSWKIN